jgi:dTDP-glucose pyrophosphorylase
MYNLNKNLPIIHKDKKIFHAIDKITKSRIKILFVVDEKKKLLGSISSGDLRRSILRKIDLNVKVKKIMFLKPKYFFKKPDDLSILKDLICVPIVNKKKQIIDFVHYNRPTNVRDNTIFLMAGGKGVRLLPLTKKIPKPLLKIKGIPIIEKIIINFRKQGFKNFLISVNYLGYKIKKYLGKGEKLNVNIDYIEENFFLGTAGSLSLIDFKKTKFPIIVTNSDLITEIDYINLIKYHYKKKSDLTICGKNKIFQIPYGEILQKSEKVKKIIEKPNIAHIINAGVYVLSKNIVKKITKNKKLMMNDYISHQIKKNKKVFCYPVYENWIDIGNKIDYEINK